MPKFSDLPTANSVGASDTFAILQGGALKQAPYSVFASTATGDVLGPASSTDNALIRFDGTTGKLIQNSAITVDDSGNLTTAGDLAARNATFTANVTATALTISGSAKVNGSNVVTMANAALSVSYGNTGSASTGTSSRWAREDHNHGPQYATVRRTLTANASVATSDNGGVIAWNAANGTITLPRSMPEGFNCLIRVVHATGTPTLVAGIGAVVHQANGKFRARKQWSEVSACVHSSDYDGETGGNVWVISGDVDS